FMDGKPIERYHILEQLGEGGMATVYRARDNRLERDVAVKVIRTDQIGPAHLAPMLKRFEREARALAKLSHPNIVKVLDYGEREGAPFLVMEFLPGGTLKEKLADRQLPWKDSIRLILSIAQALAYAHGAGIVHRDIKPSNILVTKSGEPMLSDFGIAKILEGEMAAELTGTGAGIGTPEYMAPEQAMGRTDERADIYALGVVLYQMITGHVPFRADTPMAVLLKKSTEPLPRPSQFVSSLPASVENLLIKALACDPENRYPSMSALVQALEEALIGPETTATISEGYHSMTLPAIPPKDAEKRRKYWVAWFAGAGLLSACCAVVAGAIAWGAMAPSKVGPVVPTNTARVETPIQTQVLAATATRTLAPLPTDTPGPTSVPPTSTATSVQPRIFDFRACLGACDGANARTAFPERIVRIGIHWQYANIPAGAHYTRSWRHADFGVWVTYDCRWDQPSSGAANIFLWDEDGLASGEWIVTMTVNEALLLEESIYIEGNYRFWDPAVNKNTCFGD
ncbi:MAG: protein kinase, partial [Chloroflexota bacterium]